MNLFHRFIKLTKSAYHETNLRSDDAFIDQATNWGYCDNKWLGSPKILIAAGHGYGNVGDEAQLAACLSRWHKFLPNCKITLFSPNPAYTAALHNEHCVWAPRVAWFRSNTIGPYDGRSKRYYSFYKLLRIRIVLSAYLLKWNIPLLFCWPREAEILSELQAHDCLHISGGGYLTGATRSRLWENCLLMRVCQILQIPYFLTGHNIGVLTSKADKRITQWGLKGAKYISLRDRGISQQILSSLGLDGQHIESTCDDALLCDINFKGDISKLTTKFTANIGKYAVVNFHHWGMAKEEVAIIEARFAEICDYISQKHGLHCLLVSMAPGDIQPCQNICNHMSSASHVVPYSPDWRVARGLISRANLCFTMKHHPIVFAIGELTPVVSVSLDQYYNLKNQGVLDNIEYGFNAADRDEFFSPAILSLIDNAILGVEQYSEACRKYLHRQRSLEQKPYTYIGLS
jgi:polysaccharide pyruvyl transferase WcaK-like protein